jgi:hypothetical protein
MNKSFLGLSDAALKSGLLSLNPGLENELKHVTETFVTLAKTAASEECHAGEEENVETITEAARATNNAATLPPMENTSNQPPALQHTDVGWGYSATLAEEPPSRDRTTPRKQVERLIDSFFQPVSTSSAEANQLVLKQSRLGAGQIFDQSRSWAHTTFDDQQQLPFGLVDVTTHNQTPHQNNRSTYPFDILTPDVTPPSTRLPSPLHPNLNTKTTAPKWTYSHDESTFARRLTRSALETGYHLLGMASLKPSTLQYAFKLSLAYMSLDELRDRFKVLLTRGTSEDLDFWGTPFIHLGGAGTHYPRKDPHGNKLHIPNAWTIRSIGPLSANRIRAENTADPSKSHDLNVDLTGLEGEWFDAHDVQGYLEEEKGCYIDPKDLFTEVLIDADDDAGASNVAYSNKVNLNLELSELPKTSQLQAPGLIHSSSSSSNTEANSNKSTPDGNDIETMLGSNETFGLDMAGPNFNTGFPKFSEIDASTVFNEPLGLDLAPMYDHSINNSLAGFNTSAFGDMSNLGLDLMGGEISMPAVKPKRRKTAWLDVSKLIDGEFDVVSVD